YRRQEGEKALYRLLGENEGSFAFTGGAAAALRRIEIHTNSLLMEGMRQHDEVRAKRARLGAELLVVEGELAADAARLEQEIASALGVPRSLDELLDELGAPDLELLEATERLIAAGHVKRIDETAPRPELASPDRLQLLAALVKRLSREGYSGGARLV